MRKSASKPNMSHEKIKTSTEVLRALAHPLRLKILQYIDTNKEVHVNKIYSALQLEQSITSQHLRILRAKGLVKTVRDGKFINYAVDYEKVGETQQAVKDFTKIENKG
jgi:DNA-binding transcriptional ArsR family regulator